MRGDLEQNLVDAGLQPAAAKIIANALGNSASPQLDVGRRLQDATPASRMRMVTADTRRYVLTNLDQPGDDPYARASGPPANRYQPSDREHPYRNSQPASAQPTLAVPGVSAGDYVQVTQNNKDGVSQATVSLRLTRTTGRHPRLNPATGEVEGVPFSARVGQEQLAEAHFEEGPEGTVLVVNFKGISEFTISGTTFLAWRA
jgi:hypothetical protein